MTWDWLLIGYYTLIGYAIAAALLAAGILATRRLPRARRIQIRTILATAFLAPGLLVDPAVIFANITPAWFVLAMYLRLIAQYGLQDMSGVLRLFSILVCQPLVIGAPVTLSLARAILRSAAKRP